MKCPNCGANLELEDRFCPHCGTENKMAKKHSEDMRKYERDYKKTKNEVMDNSRKFNLKTFRITVAAVTVAALLLLIFFAAFTDSISYERKRSRGEKKAVQYEAEIRNLIAADDYLGLNELITREDLYFSYNSSVYKYSYAKSISSEYFQIEQDIWDAMTGSNSENMKESLISGIADTAGYAYRVVDMVENDEDADELTLKFVKDCANDIGLMLKTYLGLTDEQVASIPELSDAKLVYMIEEAYNNAFN